MVPRLPAMPCLAAALWMTVIVGGASDASAQAASSLNFSNLPFPPSLLQQSAPAPLTPEPGGAFTAQTVTMPVPPLARATIPSAAGPGMADTQKPEVQPEDGPSHAALDDRALEGVR